VPGLAATVVFKLAREPTRTARKPLPPPPPGAASQPPPPLRWCPALLPFRRARVAVFAAAAAASPDPVPRRGAESRGGPGLLGEAGQRQRFRHQVDQLLHHGQSVGSAQAPSSLLHLPSYAPPPSFLAPEEAFARHL